MIRRKRPHEFLSQARASPVRMPGSTPPIQTPNTPNRAFAYGVTASTAKQVVKHSFKFESLMSLLLHWGGIVLERGSLPSFQDLGEAIERLGTLLVMAKVIYIQVANVLSKKPEKYTYSGLTATHIQQILKENNAQSKGKIVVPSMDELLKDLPIPASFSCKFLLRTMLGL